MTELTASPARARRLLYSTLIVVTVLVFLEGLSWVGERPSRYVTSELLGYELRPGFHRRHRRYTERFNRLGLRGPEIRPEKKSGTFRILALGGSTTYGYLLDDLETWPRYLEENLKRRGWSNVQVLNGGVPGWGLEQIVLALEHRRLEELDPDLVILYSGWNHPARHCPAVEEFARKAGSTKDRSWLYRFALPRRLERWRRKFAPNSPAIGDLVSLEEQRRVLLPPLFDRLVTLTRRRSAALAIVRFPALVHFPPPPESAGALWRKYDTTLRHKFNDNLPLSELYAAAHREYRSALVPSEAAAMRHGVPLLDVVGSLAAGARRTADPTEAWWTYFTDRMHLSPRGNEAVAAALLEHLEATGLLPPKGD